MIGSELGHYRIEEKLGAGGMGEVYLAEDLKLHRKVALKVLPPELAREPERLRRFQREAESVAALSHPNIVTLFSVEEDAGTHFLTMERVDGQTLAEIIPPGGLPLDRVLDLGVAIADALAAAHEAGVIHRDLKPSNIMIDRRGHLRVMDFGLAKLVRSAPDAEASDAPTEALTREGTQPGTVPYMAPEQVHGREVDERTDLFALGVVLYEMATGERPFRGESLADLMSSILRDEPTPIAEERPDLPRQLDRIVRHCLEKDPARRFQTAIDLRNELDSLRDEMEEESVMSRLAPAAAPSPSVPRWMIVVLLFGVALGLGWWLLGGAREESQPVRPATGEAAPERRLSQVTFGAELEEWPAWSPDGERLVYSAERDGFLKLFLRDLASGASEQLTSGRRDDVQAAWSPDGTKLVFVRASSESGKMELDDLFGSFFVNGDVWQLDLESGAETRLLRNAFSPAFSPDGERLAFNAAPAGPMRIWTADAAGRNPRQVTTDTSEAVEHVEPSWSPDGRRIVYRRYEKSKSDLEVADVASGEVTVLTDDGYRDMNPRWTPDGESIVFSSYRGGGQNVWSLPVTPDGRPAGPARQLTTGAGSDIQLAVDPSGRRIAFAVLGINADVWQLPVDPSTAEPTGPAEALVATTREESRGVWSPDGGRLAFNSDRLGQMNLWLLSRADGELTQLTSGEGGDFQPNWSPDGTSIAFFSSRAGNVDIWAVDVDSGELRQLTEDPGVDEDPFYSPDGRQIAFQSDRDGRLEVWVMDADGSNERKLSSMATSGHFVRWLPDGSGVVHRAADAETTLHVLPLDGSPARPWLDTPGAGWHISFSPDRRLVLDARGHLSLWVFPVDGSAPRQIFAFDDPDVRIDYPVFAPDGESVVFERGAPSGADIWLLEGVG
ncbi:MAG: protein kinase [Thermoanaerobaculia bacterium]|nr:protein kinase [Thermoanaerobaculia bacterium]